MQNSDGYGTGVYKTQKMSKGSKWLARKYRELSEIQTDYRNKEAGAGTPIVCENKEKEEGQCWRV